jgi:hypothetical protein
MTFLHYMIELVLLIIIVYLSYDRSLGMLNGNGGRLVLAIMTFPVRVIGGYTLIFADVDRLKQLNKVTMNHFETNRLLRGGFQVRRGEIAWKIYGDEFAFLIRGDGHAFCHRIARQLAAQPLSQEQRVALSEINGYSIDEAKLSATFAVLDGVRHLWPAMEVLSQDVLCQKEIRDRGVL